jgi:hypothetical protein
VQDVRPCETTWDVVAREYGVAAREAKVAWQLMQQALALGRTAADRHALQEELWLTELIYRTFLACEHVVHFLQARDRYEAGTEAALTDMRRIATRERDNAAAALPIYQQARWLDINERTDGKYSSCVEMITEKVAWIDRFIATTQQ